MKVVITKHALDRWVERGSRHGDATENDLLNVARDLLKDVDPEILRPGAYITLKHARSGCLFLFDVKTFSVIVLVTVKVLQVIADPATRRTVLRAYMTQEKDPGVKEKNRRRNRLEQRRRDKRGKGDAP